MSEQADAAMKRFTSNCEVLQKSLKAVTDRKKSVDAKVKAALAKDKKDAEALEGKVHSVLQNALSEIQQEEKGGAAMQKQQMMMQMMMMMNQ